MEVVAKRDQFNEVSNKQLEEGVAACEADGNWDKFYNVVARKINGPLSTQLVEEVNGTNKKTGPGQSTASQ